MSRAAAPIGSIGKYAFISQIGNGGFGVVYLAEDTVLGRLVAVKVLPSHLVADKKSLKRFRGEAKLVARLHHPNIVRIHSFDIVDGEPLIEMEYIAGGSLADRLRKSAVTHAEAIRWAHDVASALAECHALGMVHRDVKPSNILLNQFGRAQLADFGISSILDSSERDSLSRSQTTSFRGTPHYAAPEAWEGGTPTPAWDIYALGAVMYEALTGAPPHGDVTHLELARRVAVGRIADSVRQYNTSVSTEAAALVEAMLSHRPAERPASAKRVIELIEALPEFAGQMRQADEYATTPAAITLENKVRRTRRSKFLVIVAAVAATFAAASVLLPLGRDTATRRSPDGSGSSLKVDLAVERAQDVNAFLSSRRGTFPGGEMSLRMSVADEDAISDELWLMELVDDAPARIFCLGTSILSVANLDATGRAGEYTLDGAWAEYADVNGTVMRHGRARGRVHWQSSSATLAGAIDRFDETAGGIRRLSVLGVNTPPYTDAAFFHALEESDFLLPLVWNELVTRGLTWAEDVVKLLPAFPAGSITTGPVLESEDAIRIDGLLDDAGWATDSTSDNQLAAYPPKAKAVIQFKIGPDTLYVAATTGARAPATSFELHLMPGYHVPMKSSPRFALAHDGHATSFSPENVAAVRHAECVSATSSDGWVVECAVPLAALLPRGGAADGEWRFNAEIRNSDAESDAAVLARWGFPDPSQVQHGAALGFASAPVDAAL
jgi:serine/threonine protein kinase